MSRKLMETREDRCITVLTAVAALASTIMMPM
jgi:hypothetical protein